MYICITESLYCTAETDTLQIDYSSIKFQSNKLSSVAALLFFQLHRISRVFISFWGHQGTWESAFHEDRSNLRSLR